MRVPRERQQRRERPRILDPLRAEWYEKQGVNTICPTRIAIEMLEKEVLEAAGAGSSS